MAGSFKNNTRGGNKNTQDLVGAQFVHIDGGTLVTVVPNTAGARLIRVVINTKGLSLNIRSGSRVIGVIGAAVVEQELDYGVYCDSGIQVDVGGSGGSVTMVYSS